MRGNVNHHYFDEIDTEEKAYFLGFLYAGCLMSKTSNRVIISTGKEDLYILEHMRYVIQHGKKLTFIDNNKYHENSTSQLYRFDFFSERLKNNINTLNVDKIPTKLHHHFLRGFFDKKGYIIYDSKNNPRIKFSGTKEKLNVVSKIFQKTFNITTTPVKRNKSCFNLDYFGREKCITIRRCLYNNCTILSNSRMDKMEKICLKDVVEKGCLIEGCNQPFSAKGYCYTHYRKHIYGNKKPKNKEEDNKYFKIDRVGEVYKTKQGSSITIISYRNYSDCDIMLETGEILENIPFYRIKKGTISDPNIPSVKGIGYMGVGKYTSKINNIHQRNHIIWKGLISRCYGDRKDIVEKSYGDVTVCEEWHNFQNFAKWYEENYKQYMDKWAIDKDILCPDCREYSPDTCVFVPTVINNFFNKEVKNATGVIKLDRGYRASISKNGKKYQIGVYSTFEEAHEAYKEEKLKFVKEVADEYKGLVDPRVYEAMYNYFS